MPINIKNLFVAISLLGMNHASSADEVEHYDPHVLGYVQQYVIRSDALASAVVLEVDGNRILALTASHNIHITKPAVNGLYPAVLPHKNNKIYRPDLEYNLRGYKGSGYASYIPAYTEAEVYQGTKHLIHPKNDFGIVKLEGSYPDLYPLKGAEANEGDLVVSVGFQRDSVIAIEGLIAPDFIRQDMLDTNRELDPNIPPFDPEAEFFIITDSQAHGGMSGGGVFNTRGELVGIIARSGTYDEKIFYVRAVRISYIAAQCEKYAINVSGTLLEPKLSADH